MTDSRIAELTNLPVEWTREIRTAFFGESGRNEMNAVAAGEIQTLREQLKATEQRIDKILADLAEISTAHEKAVHALVELEQKL